MDQTLLVWSLISLCCCSIVTTGIVYDIIVFEFINENYVDVHAERTAKAFSPFALIELVSSIVLITLAEWPLVPFILLVFAWFISVIALYQHYLIAHDGATIGREDNMKRANILRAIIWFSRFVCLFVFITVN
jgi:hypothetical protein